MTIDYDGRVFRPVVNAPNGEVTASTEFHYRQAGDLLTATYTGGGIRLGQMVGLVGGDGSLHFHYQHLTDTGELRCGICRGVPERLPDGRLRLHETWQWLSGDRSEGQSVVEEVSAPRTAQST
jgi:hypothetical protein